MADIPPGGLPLVLMEVEEGASEFDRSEQEAVASCSSSASPLDERCTPHHLDCVDPFYDDPQKVAERRLYNLISGWSCHHPSISNIFMGIPRSHLVFPVACTRTHAFMITQQRATFRAFSLPITELHYQSPIDVEVRQGGRPYENPWSPMPGEMKCLEAACAYLGRLAVFSIRRSTATTDGGSTLRIYNAQEGWKCEYSHTLVVPAAAAAATEVPADKSCCTQERITSCCMSLTYVAVLYGTRRLIVHDLYTKRVLERVFEVDVHKIEECSDLDKLIAYTVSEIYLLRIHQQQSISGDRGAIDDYQKLEHFIPSDSDKLRLVRWYGGSVVCVSKSYIYLRAHGDRHSKGTLIDLRDDYSVRSVIDVLFITQDYCLIHTSDYRVRLIDVRNGDVRWESCPHQIFPMVERAELNKSRLYTDTPYRSLCMFSERLAILLPNGSIVFLETMSKEEEKVEEM